MMISHFTNIASHETQWYRCYGCSNLVSRSVTRGLLLQLENCTGKSERRIPWAPAVHGIEPKMAPICARSSGIDTKCCFDRSSIVQHQHPVLLLWHNLHVRVSVACGRASEGSAVVLLAGGGQSVVDMALYRPLYTASLHAGAWFRCFCCHRSCSKELNFTCKTKCHILHSILRIFGHVAPQAVIQSPLMVWNIPLLALWANFGAVVLSLLQLCGVRRSYLSFQSMTVITTAYSSRAAGMALEA